MHWQRGVRLRWRLTDFAEVRLEVCLRPEAVNDLARLESLSMVASLADMGSLVVLLLRLRVRFHRLMVSCDL